MAVSKNWGVGGGGVTISVPILIYLELNLFRGRYWGHPIWGNYHTQKIKNDRTGNFLTSTFGQQKIKVRQSAKSSCQRPKRRKPATAACVAAIYVNP